jgi:hypothetical protein
VAEQQQLLLLLLLLLLSVRGWVHARCRHRPKTRDAGGGGAKKKITWKLEATCGVKYLADS